MLQSYLEGEQNNQVEGGREVEGRKELGEKEVWRGERRAESGMGRDGRNIQRVRKLNRGM